MSELSQENKIQLLEESLYKFINRELPHYSNSERSKLVTKNDTGFSLKLKLENLNPSLKGVSLIFSKEISKKSSISKDRKEVTLFLLKGEEVQDKEGAIEVLLNLKEYYIGSFRNEFKKQLGYLLEELEITLDEVSPFNYSSSEINSFIAELSERFLKEIDDKTEAEVSAEEKIKSLNEVLSILKLESNKFFEAIATEEEKDYLEQAKKNPRNIFRLNTRIKALQKGILSTKAPHLKQFIYNLEKGLNTDTLVGNIKEIIKSNIDNDTDLEWFFSEDFTPELWNLFLSIFLKKNFGEKINLLSEEEIKDLKEETKKAHNELKDYFDKKRTDAEKEFIDVIKVFISSIPERVLEYSKKYEGDGLLEDVIESKKTLYGYATSFILTDYKEIKDKNPMLNDYKEELASIIEKSFEQAGLLKSELEDKMREIKENPSLHSDLDEVVADIGKVKELNNIDPKDLIPFIQTSKNLNLDNMKDNYLDKFSKREDKEFYSEVIDEVLKKEYSEDWLSKVKEILENKGIKKEVIHYYKKFILSVAGNIKEELKISLKIGYGSEAVKSSSFRSMLVRLFKFAKEENYEEFIKILKRIPVEANNFTIMEGLINLFLKLSSKFKKMEEVPKSSLVLKIEDIMRALEGKIADIEQEVKRYPLWPESNGESPQKKLIKYNNLFNNAKQALKEIEVEVKVEKEKAPSQKPNEMIPEKGLSSFDKLKDLKW